MLLSPLAAWERGGVSAGDDCEAILAEERTQLYAATVTLARLAPTLAALDRTHTCAELYMSTVRWEDQGGFELPAELAAAAAAAHRSIGPAILVMAWPDEENTHNEGEDEGRGRGR